jgi:hypothetical protein
MHAATAIFTALKYRIVPLYLLFSSHFRGNEPRGTVLVVALLPENQLMVST